MLGRRLATVAAALTASVICGTVGIAGAQDMPPVLAPPPSPAQPPLSAVSIPPASPSPAAQALGWAPLDQLVAPIALYPDPLLGQVLMASTYPLEVVEAARWTRVPANRGLRAVALGAALKTKDWDPSVAALVPFPGVLSVMADKLEWTERLGDAFLAQEADVMAAVQRLRHAALAAGSLKATPQCHCVIQTAGDIISILPSDADLTSVPVYNPTVAYGTWADSGYPPITFPPPPGFAFPPGLSFGFEPAIEVALFGRLWGWGSIDWPNHRIVVDGARYAAVAAGRPAFPGGVWVHDYTPRHIATVTAPTVLRGPARTPAARTPAARGVRKFAMAHPPRYSGVPRHHVSALPRGTILPPPPPLRHAAIGWLRDGYYPRF
jgi:hypothetical protein